jgi:hypothetical protein
VSSTTMQVHSLKVCGVCFASILCVICSRSIYGKYGHVRA